MLSERRADELKRKSKDELIALLLEAEQVRDRVQRVLASLQDREPGRYAFWHRHLALAYVRKANVPGERVQSRRRVPVPRRGGTHSIAPGVIAGEHMGIRIERDQKPIEQRAIRCTRPCLDCIEGTHCGGAYTDDESGETIGECHEVVDERPPIGYWPPDEDEGE